MPEIARSREHSGTIMGLIVHLVMTGVFLFWRAAQPRQFVEPRTSRVLRERERARSFAG